MAFVAQQQFVKYINDNFYRGTLEAIGVASTDDKAYINGEKVNIRNAGAAPEITKGNRTYPVPVTERDDTTTTYDLINYEMGPIRIDNVDQIQTDPDLLKSVMIDLIGNQSDRAGIETLISWYHSTASKRVLTTGGSVSGHAPGSTATLKAFTGKDLLTAAGIMNRDSVPGSDRFCIVDSVMFAQLVDDLGYNQDRVEIVQGLQMIVPPVYGFKVIEVPQVIYTSNAYAIRAYGHAGATTDVAGALCVQKRCVSHAWTETEVKVDTTAVGWFAKAVVEAWKYGGGKYRRTDMKGVVPILQGA